MYENIKSVTEVRSISEVNRLLAEGWKLLNVSILPNPLPLSFTENLMRTFLLGKEIAAAPQDAEETDKAEQSLDRDQRLRMIAQAVDGMSFLDWKKARHQIDRMFGYQATVASNRVIISKTLEEIADTIKNERM